MANEIVRITGVVLSVDENRGTSKAGNPFHRRVASVLVGGRGVATVSAPAADFAPRKNDWIDWVCEADVFGGRLSINHVGDYDDTAAEAAADTLIAG